MCENNKSAAIYLKEAWNRRQRRMMMMGSFSVRQIRGPWHAALALAAAAVAGGLLGCGGRMHVVGEGGGGSGGGSGSQGSGGAQPDAGANAGSTGNGGTAPATGGTSGVGGAGGIAYFCPPGDFKSRCH